MALRNKMRGGSSAAASARRQLPRRRSMSFTPWQTPTSPPPGTYDPALDAAQRAATRGYGDMVMDSERDLQRGSSDLTNSTFDIDRGSGRTLADLMRERATANEDFTQGKKRIDEDYRRSTGQMKLGYGRQAMGQAEQARARGVSGGGTLAAALRARMGNQANDQVDIDRSTDRARTDMDTSKHRFDVASATQENRLQEDTALAKARAAEGFGRGGADLATGLARAGRELGFFGQDTAEQRFFQAAESGRYTMPGRGEPGGAPSNEFEDEQGPYRIIVRGNQRLKVRPGGDFKSTKRRR